MDLSMVFKFDIKINKSRDNQDGIMGKLDNVIRKSMDTNNNNYLFEKQQKWYQEKWKIYVVHPIYSLKILFNRFKYGIDDDLYQIVSISVII